MNDIVDQEVARHTKKLLEKGEYKKVAKLRKSLKEGGEKKPKMQLLNE